MAYSERSIRTDRTPPCIQDRQRHKERAQRNMDSHQKMHDREHERSRDRLHRERKSDPSGRGDRPSSSNGRPIPQDPVRSQHSRPPTVYSEQYSRPPLSSSHVNNSPPRTMRPEKQSFSEKCSNMCSRRGILQFVEILANVMVLICVVASFAVTSGFTSSPGLGAGSMSLNSMYSPFEGTEFQQARELDMQYSQLRAPGVYGGVAFTLALTAITICLLIVGAKPFPQLSIRILMAGLVFEVLACISYIVAVGLYLHFITVVNATDVCKTRERLYARRGYTWMSCEVQGGDAAVAIFGLIAACLYLPSAVLSGLTIRSIRKYRRTLPPEDYIASSFRDQDYKMYRNAEDLADITLV